MKRTLFLALVILALPGCQQGDEKNHQTSSETNKPQEKAVLVNSLSNDELIQRGEYLVTVGLCHDCHSPHRMTENGLAPDPERLLSGHPSHLAVAPYDAKTTQEWIMFSTSFTAIAGPWGVSFTANITSDDTGIGTWTEEQFFTAIRQGKFKGMINGRDLLPPMPWFNYARASDEDLRAIFAYLKSTKPVRNIVPAPIPPKMISMK